MEQQDGKFPSQQKQNIENTTMVGFTPGIKFGPQVACENIKSPHHGKSATTIACWLIYECLLHGKY